MSWDELSDFDTDDGDDSSSRNSSDKESISAIKVVDEKTAAQFVRKIIKSDEGAKLENIIAKLSTDLQRPLTNMESALVERLYAPEKLNFWVDQSLQRAKAELKLREEFSTHWVEQTLDELKAVTSLEFLANNSVSSNTVGRWCCGSLLNSIVDQKETFDRLGHVMVEPLRSTVHRFKSQCSSLLIKKKVAIEKEIDTRLKLIITYLADFLDAINHHKLRSKILGTYASQLGDAEEMTRNLLEASENYRELGNPKLADSLSMLQAGEWPEQLKGSANETYRRLLSPFGINKELDDTDGRSTFKLSAVSLVWSEVKAQVEQAKSERGFQELHLVGYVAVHVDEHLENEIWHGTNIVIVTDALYVDAAGPVIVWDVSGLPGPEHCDPKAPSGTLPGENGKPGKHGLPGESGGHVQVLCNGLFNGAQWTIRSCGGTGGNGQSGGDGSDGKDGKPAKEKLLKNEFEAKFPEGAKWLATESKEAAKTIENSALAMVSESRVYVKSGADFFIDGTTEDGGRVIVSKHSGLVRKHVIVLLKGGKGERGQRGGKGGRGGEGGEGGYHGEVVVRNFHGQPLMIHADSTAITAQVNGNGQAAFGESGHDGCGGKNGKHGKAAGDVGYVDQVGLLNNWLFKTVYYGFDQERVYEMQFDESEPSKSISAMCYVKSGKLCYMSIRQASCPATDLQRGTQQEKTTQSQKSKIRAVFKNAILRSCLGVYTENVAERSRRIRESAVPSAESEMHSSQTRTPGQLESQQQQQSTAGELSHKARVCSTETKLLKHYYDHRQFDVTANKCPVTPAASSPGLYRDGVAGSAEMCCGCRQPQLDEADLRAVINVLEQCPQKETLSTAGSDAMARCLTRRRTLRDTFNVFHCLFGEIDESSDCFSASLRCPNARERLDEFISFVKTETDGAVLVGALKAFVRSVGEQTTGSAELGKYPEARRVYQVNKTERIEDFEAIENFENLRDEYAQFIENEQRLWGEEDLELLAVAYKMKIHAYCLETKDDKNPVGHNYKLYFSKTLNETGDDERYMAVDPDGYWEKLVPDSKSLDYERQKADSVATSRLDFGNMLNVALANRLESATGQDEMQEQGTEKGKTNWLNKLTNIAYQILPSSWSQEPISATQDLIDTAKGDPQSDAFQDGHDKLTGSLAATASPLSRHCAKLLDPKYGLPDVLSRLLWLQLTGSKPQDEIGSTFVESELVHAAKEIVDRLVSDQEPSRLLLTLARCCPHRWRREFAVLDIEDGLRSVLTRQDREQYVSYMSPLGDRLIGLLRSAVQKAQHRQQVQLFPSKERLAETLGLLSHRLDMTESDVELLEALSIGEWLFELKTKYWKKIVEEQLGRAVVSEEKRQEAVYIFLELENKKGHQACVGLVDKLKEAGDSCKVLETLRQCFCCEDLELEAKERTCDEIISMMKADSNTSQVLHEKLDSVARFLLSRSKSDEHQSGKHARRNPAEWARHVDRQVLSSGAVESIDEFLDVYDDAVWRKMGFRLRDTQRIAIATLLAADGNILAPVSTGEGKSVIIAAVAIARALSGSKVDIVTSNSLLAVRDSDWTTDEGGLRDLYEQFGISVANNCSWTEGDRIRAYGARVVYGELSAFQRDYLLQSFYKRNIKGERTLASVIVDEVDCMLLDRGNNMLYLSHHIPGMEALESLYVFIWMKVKASLVLDVNEIKADVMYDLYGTVTKSDLSRLLPESGLQPAGGRVAVEDEMWNRLIEAKVMDASGRLVMSDPKRISQTLVACDGYCHLSARTVFLLRAVAERRRRIRVPSHLMPFVERHLDTWIENAVRALYLREDVHYVIDQDRSGTNPDLTPLVTIIDPDTGTDMSTSQWDGALHQFLQLKHGCKLSPQSLKAVFVSNVSYFKRYAQIVGLTGTLGSEPERDFLQTMYDARFMTVPTAHPKRFCHEAARVLDDEESWLEAIVSEVRTVAVENNRSVLLFCESIRQVQLVHNRLQRELAVEARIKLHCYTRDYEQFVFEKNELQPARVIIATNLAGRGTDIKISRELNESGGLHVCLAYLPDNVRIEEQASGRAGRKGEPGSSRLVVCYPKDDGFDGNNRLSAAKIFQLKEERNRRELHRISTLRDDFLQSVSVEEKCFADFTQHYDRLKGDCRQLGCDSVEQRELCLSALDEWAMWLDSMDHEKAIGPLSPHANSMLQRMERDWPGRLELRKEPSCPSWVTPSRRITLAKHWACAKDERKREAALKLLNDLTEHNDDSYSYPAAHYYKAFVLMKASNVDKHRESITKTLKKAEQEIKRHIQHQTEYSLVISETAKMARKTDSFCDLDAYKKQKDNVIFILEQYLETISAALGRHFSRETLQHYGVAYNRLDHVFDELVEKSYVKLCRRTCESYLPRDQSAQAVREIAKASWLDANLLETFIEKSIPAAVDPGIGEDELSKRVKEANLFKTTRKTFWNAMDRGGVLLGARHCLIIQEAIWQHLDIPQENKTAVDHAARLSLEDQVPFLVVYNPTFTSLEHLRDSGKLLFNKSIAKQQLGLHYTRFKSHFESNKYALNVDEKKLGDIDLSSLDGRLTQELFKCTGILQSEWQHLWSALVRQGIVDSEGQPLDIEKLFSYPECRCYENAIIQLVQETFRCELVRRHWLEASKSNAPEKTSYLYAISTLALKPERDLLCDLLSADVIALSSVSTDADLDRRGGIDKLFDNASERQAVLTSLKSARAALAGLDRPDAHLKELETVVRPAHVLSSPSAVSQGARRALANELDHFNQIGFGEVIVLTEQHARFSRIVRASPVVLVATAQVAIGAWIILTKTGDVTTLAGQALISEGLSDVYFAFNALASGCSITWTDYARHKMASVVLTAAATYVCYRSRDVRLFKSAYERFGHLLARPLQPSVTATTAIAKEVAKSSARQVCKAVALEFAGSGAMAFVSEQMGAFRKGLVKEAVDVLQSTVTASSIDLQSADLIQLCSKLGQSIFEQFVEMKLKEVVYGEDSLLTQKCSPWIAKLARQLEMGFGMASKKRGAAAGASAVSDAITTSSDAIAHARKSMESGTLLHEIARVAVQCIGFFGAEVREKCGNLELNGDEISEIEKLEAERVINRVVCAVYDQVTSMLEKSLTEITEEAGRSFATGVTTHSKRLHRGCKPSRLYAEFQQQQEESLRKKQQVKREEKANRRTEQSGNRRPNTPRKEFVDAALKLMTKTSNPGLCADMVRAGVPLEHFCARVLGIVIPRELESNGIACPHNICIRTTTLSGSFTHYTGNIQDCGSSNTLEVILDRAEPGETLDNACSSGDGGADESDGNARLFRCVTAQIAQRYPNSDLSAVLGENQLRELVATAVERHPQISCCIIRNGWHGFTYGTEERTEGTRLRDKGKFESHFKYAKHEGVRKISQHDVLPAIGRIVREHGASLHWDTNASKRYSKFSKKQKASMQKGEYEKAIMKTIEVVIADMVVENEQEHDRIHVWHQACKDLLKYYHTNNDMEFEYETEDNQMKRRFIIDIEETYVAMLKQVDTLFVVELPARIRVVT